MSPNIENDDDRAIEIIFSRAVDLPASERRAYVDAAADGGEVLKRRVYELLSAYEEAPDFLPEVPAGQPVLPFAASQKIGDYEIIKEIARGGMGVVFSARQISLNRTVALKMILGGPFAASPSVERFRSEAQALAHLDHPNIVPVYEIGEFQGQVYFSMKLIEGGTLADWIKSPPPQGSQSGVQKTSIRETIAACRVKKKSIRLEHAASAHLIMTVAGAVHYAHQRGILHRDLKPTNILIDREDQPYVSDFGLAKLTETKSKGGQTSLILGTPSYMAPEQARSGCAELTTAADIYSLGAILFELLTGRPPFQAETALETLRLACEEEPPAPTSLNPLLDRDLGTICLKCLNQNPEARYASAQALADDLNRWLAGETILARRSTRIERAWRSARRKPAVAGLSAATIVVLLVASGVGLWQARRVHFANQLLLSEAAGNDKVVEFVRELLQGIPQVVVEGRDHTMMMELVEKAAARMDVAVPGNHRPDTNVRDVIAEIYLQLSDYPQAEIMFRHALQSEKDLHGPNHAHVARNLKGIAHALTMQDKLPEAEQAIIEGLSIPHGRGPDDLWENEELQTILANIRIRQGRAEESEKILREVIAARRQRGLASNDPHLVRALNNLSAALFKLGKLDQAESLQREALAATRKLPASEMLSLPTPLRNLAGILHEKRKYPEALDLAGEGLEISREHLGPDHRDTIEACLAVGAILVSLDRHEEAESLMSQVLESQARFKRDGEFSTANAFTVLARSLQARGKLEQAESNAVRALEICKKLPNEEILAQAMSSLSTILQKRGRLTEAEELQRDVLATRIRFLGLHHPDVAASMHNLGVILTKLQQFQEAEKLFKEALTIRRKNAPLDRESIAETFHEFAGLCFDLARLAESEKMELEAFAIFAELLGPSHRKTIESISHLSALRGKQGRFAEAEKLARDELAGRRTIMGREDPSVGKTIDELTHILWEQGKHEEAELNFREALPIYRKLLRYADTNAIVVLNRFAWAILDRNGKVAEAEELLNEILDTVKDAPGTNDLAVAERLNNMGRWLETHGRRYKAEKFYLDGLNLRKSQLGDDHPVLIDSLTCLGQLYGNQRKLDAALIHFKQAYELGRKHFAPEHESVVHCTYDLLTCFNEQRNFAEAEPILLALNEVIHRNKTLPVEKKREAIERLCKLYADWELIAPNTGKKEKSVDWENKLAKFDQDLSFVAERVN